MYSAPSIRVFSRVRSSLTIFFAVLALVLTAHPANATVSQPVASGHFSELSVATSAVDTSCLSGGSYYTWKSNAPKRIAKGSKWCIHGSGFRLIWQSDGNLVVYSGTNSGGVALWHIGTNGRGYTLNLQSDCNFVVRNSAGTAIWHTYSVNRHPGIHLCGVTLYSSDRAWGAYSQDYPSGAHYLPGKEYRF